MVFDELFKISIDNVLAHCFLGKTPRICLIIDNASWHNQQTDESKLPTRASRKKAIEDWLDQRDIAYDSSLTKAELFEIVVKFAPPRQYQVNNIKTL